MFFLPKRRARLRSRSPQRWAGRRSQLRWERDPDVDGSARDRHSARVRVHSPAHLAFRWVLTLLFWGEVLNSRTIHAIAVARDRSQELRGRC